MSKEEWSPGNTVTPKPPTPQNRLRASICALVAELLRVCYTVCMCMSTVLNARQNKQFHPMVADLSCVSEQLARQLSKQVRHIP